LRSYFNHTIVIHPGRIKSKLAIYKQADLIRYAIKEGIAKG